jgi:hypothetical protein
VLDQRRQKRSFVGRGPDLALLEGIAAPVPVAPLAFVHGPGGIGKSALLRELRRRSRIRQVGVCLVDGRDTGTAQEALATALDQMRSGECGLLLLDAYEHFAALGAQLRRDLGPSLAAGGRIVIAGRLPPEAAWLRDEWQERLLSVRLAPLSVQESRALLRARGLSEEAGLEQLVSWAEGSPLALSVAADALLAGNSLDLQHLDADELLARTMIGRLAGEELEQADHDIVAVAAIARAVDAQLLAAALPGVDGDYAETWLRGLSFAEPLGTRVTLHERVRKAVQAALTAQDPEHERQLRRRIADHLFGRAVLGELRLLIDICDLISNPTIRWGISPPPLTVRADRVMPGDVERLEEMLDAGDKEWWGGARRWIEQAPEHVIIMRDDGGELVGWRIWVTPASAPDWIDEDPIIGPWLADARSRAPEGDALLLRDGSDLVRERDSGATSPIVSAANFASVLGSGLRSVRYMYATTDPEDRQVHEFLLAFGYRRVPELDVEDGDRVVRSYVVDWGPGGVVRACRDLVYLDLGMKPPAASEGAELPSDAIRGALRSFHDPIALAVSPLARGRTGEQRSASVRKLLRQATAAAFGDSPEQRLQREAIERGYLDPDGGHAAAMHELSISRTTYFRRLAEASERVTSYVLANRE